MRPTEAMVVVVGADVATAVVVVGAAVAVGAAVVAGEAVAVGAAVVAGEAVVVGAAIVVGEAVVVGAVVVVGATVVVDAAGAAVVGVADDDVSELPLHPEASSRTARSAGNRPMCQVSHLTPKGGEGYLGAPSHDTDLQVALGC